MTLTLRFQNSGALPDGGAPIEMVGGTLTIGRGEENDLSLPDPERTLSKRHCVLEERSGDYVIIDISTNGTFLNYGQERLGDIPTPLNHGDVILVGSYELVVEIGAAAGTADPRSAAPLPPADQPPVSLGVPGNRPAAPDRLGTLDGPASAGGDFLDDLLGGPAEPPSAGGLSAREGAGVPEDPFAEAGPTPDLDHALPRPAAPARGLPDGASAPDHSPATQDYFTAPDQNQPMIPEDWDDLFAGQAPPAAPEAASRETPFGAGPESPAPSEAPAAATPAVQAPPQARSPNEGAPGAQAGAAAQQAAARAFLDAAGAGHLDIPAAELADTMARMGRVFAAMVAGMREVLMTRASIKSELRMNRTMINMGGNNPLKFSISAEQAIEAMIRPSVPGYLDPEAAATEALNDIKAHEVAMMSGMEAALKDLLARLGPEQLSARIEAAATLGSLLSGKKARYWEAYEKMYAQIAKETEDDFQSAFGREFARAYEEQLKKL